MLSFVRLLGAIIRPPADKYVVYGRRLVDGWTTRAVTAGVHANFDTEREAKTWLMKLVLSAGGGSKVTAVIVRLDGGVDANGKRHVINRTNQDARAWWE